MAEVIPIEVMIKEVKRELHMREDVYKRRVAAGKMPPEEMTRKIAIMQAVLAQLEKIQVDNRKQTSLDL